MAVAAGITEDLELLERLSWFVVWAGRYPLPGTAEQMMPRTMDKSRRVIPRVIRVEEVQRADELAERLHDQATPWK